MQPLSSSHNVLIVLKNADKIVVLDKGKIVGMGTHEELIKTSKVYLEIAESQLSQEELSR